MDRVTVCAGVRIRVKVGVSVRVRVMVRALIKCAFARRAGICQMRSAFGQMRRLTKCTLQRRR